MTASCPIEEGNLVGDLITEDAANCQDDADACTYAGALLRLPEVQGASPLLYPSAQLNARQALPCTPCLALASA